VLIASVLAFCLGIYLQAVCPSPPALLLCFALVGIAFAGILLYIPRSTSPLVALFILLCFGLSGAARLGLHDMRQPATEAARGEDIYEGLVVESASRVKVLSLLKPAGLEERRVAFVSADALETGDIVRAFGKLENLNPTFDNPGTKSWSGLKRQEGVMWKIKGRVVSVRTSNNPINKLRRYFKKNIERSGAERQDVLKALTIGDRAAIPRETNDLFTRSGTAHVLAVSGFNVSIISGFFFIVARSLLRRVKSWRLSGRDSRYAALFTLPFPFMFMLVGGGGVSLIRAAIMASVFLVALFLEKQRHLYNTMALAALAVLVLYPHSLMTPSFLLTFTSLAFIVMFMESFYPLIARINNRALSWSASTLLSTLAATIGTAPIVVFYFCGINPLCFIHNLFTVPLIGVCATTLALVGMVVPAGHCLLTVAGYIVELNMTILRTLDFGYLYPLVRPSLADTLLYYALLVGVVYVRRKPVAVALCVAVLPLAAAQARQDYHDRFNDDLKISFIDVGLGDAALIEAPGGVRILIDGGGYQELDFDVGRQVIAPFLLYRKVRRIDYVINTHPHADHVRGLAHILENFPVSHLVTSGSFVEDTGFRHLIETATKRGIDHAVWKKGDRVTFGGFSMEVLHPRSGLPRANLNEASLVLRITYHAVSFLFPGDIEDAQEEDLILSGSSLGSDVLKIPHHGSSRSNDLSFIYAVSPRVAVLSSAGGVKGLPSPETLERYRKAGVPVFSTYRNGLVEVWSDGRRIGTKIRRR
jgi:competence protein ComEC